VADVDVAVNRKIKKGSAFFCLENFKMGIPRHLEYVQFQGMGYLSRMLQRWTCDTDSHSAVLDRESIYPGRQLIEQWPHNGGLKSWMDYNDFSGHAPGTPYQVWSLKVTADDYDWIMGKYRKSALAKKEYNWSGVMAFGFYGDGDPDKTFCSEEMVMHLAQRMGWNRIKPVTIYPGAFRNILQAAGAVPTISGVV